jgi:hypothetical protein
LAVSTITDGVTRVHVHGPGGPGTAVILRRLGGVEVTLPSATIANAHPDDLEVAWDGEKYVMCEGLADIIEANNLEWVASVIPIELLEVFTGIKPALFYGPNEVERRRQLLEEYKAATGNPSNKKIWEAENSPIYKPEFYKWRDGRLPASSATTRNFERFLGEKKPPTRSGR